MKILYCLAETCNSGGTERIVIAKANELAKRGHDVAIATVNQNGNKDFFALHSSITRFDLDVNYEMSEVGNIVQRKLRRQRKKARHKHALAELLAKYRFDVVVSTFGNEMKFLPSMKDGSKKILEIHSTRDFRLHNQRRGIMGIYDRWLTKEDVATANRFDAFVCLTERDAAKWRGVRNLHVIPNPVDRISNSVAPLKAKRVMAAGRLSKEKGYDRMLLAWSLVREKYPDWHLDIFGNGPLREQLLRQIDETGIGDSVSINEPVTDISAEYRSSSALLLTSHYEGLPMVLLEGLGCGLPLVAFDIDCGPSDLIDNGKNGWLVPDGDIAGFADAVCGIIESEELRQKMGAASLEKAPQFSAAAIIDRWEELFRTV